MNPTARRILDARKPVSRSEAGKRGAAKANENRAYQAEGRSEESKRKNREYMRERRSG